MDERYLWTLCNMWHVCWIMYDLGCMLMVNRDPLWYSTDYRVYMGSSMIVRPLAGCHCTCTLVNWLVLLHLSPAPIVVIVRGAWPFLGEEPKGTLVDCSWLVWSSSCVGCAAPYWGFGLWCQLARERLSECIATIGSSLPASRWTSVKNHCVILSLRISLIFIVIDWSSLATAV